MTKCHHVGGKQVNFLDGQVTPLECRSGLMYMSLFGKPTDQDLEAYPDVLLTSPHEWDPSVFNTLTQEHTPLGHLIHLLEINMPPRLMNVVASSIELFRHYPFSQLNISHLFTNKKTLYKTESNRSFSDT